MTGLPPGREAGSHSLSMNRRRKITMAKGQKRSNREIKKPKGTKKPAAIAAQQQLPIKTATSKGGGK